MEQYIKKSALVEEVKKLIDEIYAGRPFDALSSEQQTALWYVKSIMSSINSLEVKEVDLEEEIKKYSMELAMKENNGDWLKDITATAKYFFELGLFSQLTWKDIRLISEIGEDFMNSEESDNLGEEEYYTMILNKLKEKGRDYKTDRQITRELEQKGE